MAGVEAMPEKRHHHPKLFSDTGGAANEFSSIGLADKDPVQRDEKR